MMKIFLVSIILMSLMMATGLVVNNDVFAARVIGPSI